MSSRRHSYTALFIGKPENAARFGREVSQHRINRRGFFSGQRVARCPNLRVEFVRMVRADLQPDNRWLRKNPRLGELAHCCPASRESHLRQTVDEVEVAFLPINLGIGAPVAKVVWKHIRAGILAGKDVAGQRLKREDADACGCCGGLAPEPSLLCRTC